MCNADLLMVNEVDSLGVVRKKIALNRNPDMKMKCAKKYVHINIYDFNPVKREGDSYESCEMLL